MNLQTLGLSKKNLNLFEIKILTKLKNVPKILEFSGITKLPKQKKTVNCK